MTKDASVPGAGFLRFVFPFLGPRVILFGYTPPSYLVYSQSFGSFPLWSITCIETHSQSFGKLHRSLKKTVRKQTRGVSVERRSACSISHYPSLPLMRCGYILRSTRAFASAAIHSWKRIRMNSISIFALFAAVFERTIFLM